jgi:hypothetical protein
MPSQPPDVRAWRRLSGTVAAWVGVSRKRKMFAVAVALVVGSGLSIWFLSDPHGWLGRRSANSRGDPSITGWLIVAATAVCAAWLLALVSQQLRAVPEGPQRKARRMRLGRTAAEAAKRNHATIVLELTEDDPSTYVAKCGCGWSGPERGSRAQADADALEHAPNHEPAFERTQP